MTKISLVVVVVLLIPLATAEIKSVQITADSRSLILFEKFGFTRFGHVTISLSSVSFTSYDPSRLGFFLLTDPYQTFQKVWIEDETISDFCILDSHFIQSLFTFKDLNSPKHSFNVTTPNEYNLYFANCQPENQVSMHVTTEIYNLVGAAKDYLPAGQTQLPLLYLEFTVPYFMLLGVWGLVCVWNRLFVRRIHVLIGGLILMKALNLICAAEDKHHVKVTGTPHGWDLLFYVSHFIRVTFLYTVIVLIGTGWSILKPALQERERANKLLMIVIPLQVAANIAFVVVGETGPFFNYWITWNWLFVMIDLLCCLAIVSHSCWFITRSRETSSNLTKFTLFKQFYIMVIVFLYFTRFFLFWLRSMVFPRMISAYKYQWVIDALEEIATLSFYLVMFYMLLPSKNNLYFLIDEEEKEEATAQQIPKDEEFGL